MMSMNLSEIYILNRRLKVLIIFVLLVKVAKLKL